MSFFNETKMDTGIRFYIVDPIEDCVLATTRDHRVAQALSAGFLDSKIEIIHDFSFINRHIIAWTKDNLDKFENANVRLGNPVTVVDDTLLSAEYKERKILANARKRIITVLFMIADATNYGMFYDNFMDFEAFSVMNDALKDPAMLKEYSSCLGISEEEAEKEIRLRIESRKYSVVKLQGHVDKLTKEINNLTNPQEVLDMAQEISYRITGVVRA